MSRRIIVTCTIALAALAGSAAADPPAHHAVQVRHADCTRQPTPRSIKLRAKPAKPGAIRFGVLGPPKLCGDRWRATRTGRRIELHASPPLNQKACTACSAIIEVGDLPPGYYTVRLDGAKASARSKRPPRKRRAR